jgi:NADH:ubiquinone oxidoreductase subunit F (NADH-binding)
MKAAPHPEMMRLIMGRIRAKGYVGEKDIEGISSRLRIPSSRVYGFVSQFDELPQRPHVARIRVCTGPACADAGAWAVLDELRYTVPDGVEVLAHFGILRRHRSPAVYIETLGDEPRLAEGLGPDDTVALVAALGKRDLSSYKPLKDIQLPGVEALPGHEPAAWSVAAAGGRLPDPWGPELIRRVKKQPEEVLRMIAENTAYGEWGRDGLSPATLVCDVVGAEPENSTSFAALLLNPRAVIAGAAMAAAACGARELVFYLPWDEVEAVEAFEHAAVEMLSGAGIKHSVFRGPLHVPCAVDIGRVAVISGMMLWHAASIYGWSGTRSGDPPRVVLDSELAMRLPWSMEEQTARERSSLRCLAGLDGAPRFLDIPTAMGLQDILDSLGLESGEGGTKAVYAGGTTAAVSTSRDVGGETLGKAGEIVLLDTLACMPRWALYLAWHAERACCGGCVPGRTAPAAAARLMRDILGAEAGETVLDDLESLLLNVGELALCPRLQETLNPILDCLREFKGEFEAHAKEGVCRSGSCSPAVEAATHGG